MDHSHDEPTSPGDDAALAQTLLAKGELVHGAFHLAGALCEEPLNADWLELLDRFVEASSSPLELAPLKDEPEGNWVGIVALRALILARIGRLPEAIALVVQTVMARADKPYLDWAIEWLENEPEAGAQVDRKVLLSFFGSVLGQYPGTLITDPSQFESLGRLHRFASQTIGDPDSEILLIYVRVA